MNDDRARDALALAEAALAHATARRRHRGRGAGHGRGLGADPVRQQRDPPERRRDATSRSTCGSSSASGSGVASSGRTDDEGLRRLAENATAIARVVEELDDWGGLPGPTEIRDVPAAYSPPTAEASPEFRAEAVRAVIAAADDAGVDGLRLVRDRPRIDGGRQLERRPGRRHADDLAAHHGLDGSRRRDRLRRGGRGGRLDHRRRGARPRGRRQGARDGRRRLGRARRLPGRARGIRRRRPPRHARLPRVLGARGPGGAQLRRARQADRQRPRDDRRRRLRPGRACRSGSTSRASPSSASTLVERGVCRGVVYDAQTAARAGVALHRPRPAGPEPVGSVPAQHGHGRRGPRRARS